VKINAADNHETRQITEISTHIVQVVDLEFTYTYAL